MFKFFEPNKIFQITSKAPKYVLLLFMIVLSIGLTEALFLSPEDYKQSDAVRIMYVHVPCLLYTSPSPRDFQVSRMPSSA